MAGESQELAEIFKSMGYAQPNKVIDLVQKVIWDELREEYRSLIDEWTVEHTFDADDAMTLFDRAVRRMKGKR